MRVVWARPLLTAGLIDSYYELLEAAVHANCRFWHLDLRQRIWPAATFMHWLANTFAPLATQRLSGPVYVACWLGSQHRPQVEEPITVNMRQQVAKVGLYPVFFDKEADARAWLLQQQAATGPK
ncbi:MAG: hypothetical protein EOO59_06540 [Hymenobacter sp.]|nr:MAG: hypothetical protein EOO59_06540 [Hymenobacter sp.]